MGTPSGDKVFVSIMWIAIPLVKSDFLKLWKGVFHIGKTNGPNVCRFQAYGLCYLEFVKWKDGLWNIPHIIDNELKDNILENWGRI